MVSVTAKAETPSNKRIASSPLSDEITRKHHTDELNSDDLLIHWDDQESRVSENWNRQDGQLISAELEKSTLPQTPTSIESKIGCLSYTYR